MPTNAPVLSRKLAAILSADVAGYSRLMRQDESAAVAAHRLGREAIVSAVVRHGGRVVHTAGDSVLAEFASAVHAVQCAVETQKTLAAQNGVAPETQRMHWRIGINLCDVMSGGDDLHGDGVNIAARVQELADPGGICLSGAVYSQIRHLLDLHYEFLGRHKVKNIDKLVPMYRIGLEPARFPFIRAWRAVARPRVAGAGLALLVLVFTTAAYWRGWLPLGYEPTSPIETKSAQTIAVLPFVNKSDDPAQEYFADGITDDLITDLTKMPGLIVIARDSTFTYKDRPADIREIARRLSARYVLEGSVHRAAQRVRINAQLVDATSGKNLWADRFEGELSQISALQDRITGQIVLALALKLTSEERGGPARSDTANLAAYEYFLRGREQFFRYTREGNRAAKGLYGKAVDLDPKFARAHVMLAWTHWLDYQNGWAEAPKTSLDRALALANQGLALDDSLPVGYFVRALVYRTANDYRRSLVEAEKAIALDPNFANAHVLLATLLHHAGRHEETLKRMKQAMRLNPHYPSNYSFHVGQSLYTMRRYDEAIAAFKQGLESNPTSARSHMWLAAAYAQQGNLDEAEWEREQTYALDPAFSIDQIQRAPPYGNPTDIEHIVTGLKKAGFK